MSDLVDVPMAGAENGDARPVMKGGAEESKERKRPRTELADYSTDPRLIMRLMATKVEKFVNSDRVIFVCKREGEAMPCVRHVRPSGAS